MTTTTTSARAREAMGMPAPGTEVSVFEDRQNERIAVVRSMLPAFQDAMRNTEDAKVIMRDGITAIRTTPKLVLCTQESFLGALMTAAQLRLRPNVGVLGHCWVLPFEDKKHRTHLAQFILGYRGMVTLGGRSGLSVDADTAYEHDVYFRVLRGSERRIEHEPELDIAKRGDPIAHYAFARSATGEVWRVIGHAEALLARDRSPGYRFGGSENPWRLDADNGWPMCRKTAIRRLFAYIPTDSPELAQALAADESVQNLDQTSLESTTVEPSSYTVTRAEPEPTVVEAEQAEAETTSKRQRKTKHPTEPTVDANLPEDEQRSPFVHPMTTIRAGLLKRLRDAHAHDTWKAALRMATRGHSDEFDLCTDEEIMAAIKFTPAEVEEWLLAQADEKAGV